MKSRALLQVLIVLTCVASAEPQGDSDPGAEFRKGLGKLEDAFLGGMRALAEKAVSVRIFRINPKASEINPFGSYPEDRFLVFNTLEGGIVYQVLKEGNPVKDRDGVKAWAHAMLPTEDHAFALCEPTPGFAVKFVNAEGSTIYQSTICLKCSSTVIEFPRYSDRIGVDAELIKNLLKAQGIDPIE